MPVNSKRKTETSPIAKRANGNGGVGSSSFSPIANVPTDYVAFDSDQAMESERERIKNAIDQMRRFNKLAPTVIKFYEELTVVWQNIQAIQKAFTASEISREKALAGLEVLGKKFDTLVEQIVGKKDKAVSEIDRRHQEFQARLNGSNNGERTPFEPGRQRQRA